MDVPVLDGARCEVSEIKQWWGAPGASLQETLGLRSSPEEPGRRKDLLRFADNFPGLGEREDGHRAEVELETHWENRSQWRLFFVSPRC